MRKGLSLPEDCDYFTSQPLLYHHHALKHGCEYGYMYELCVYVCLLILFIQSPIRSTERCFAKDSTGCAQALFAREIISPD